MAKIVAIAVAAALLAAATGVPLFLQLNNANDRIESLTDDKMTLLHQVDSLGSDLSGAQETINDLNGDLDSLQSQFDTTSNELNSTKTELATSKDELSAANLQINNLSGELSAANQEINRLTGELEDASSQINILNGQITAANTQISLLSDELTAIQEKYPLQDFSSYAELSDWVSSHIQPYSSTFDTWYSHALKVQQLAADDGYYISACLVPEDEYIMVFNAALVGNTLYVWDPEDPALYDWGQWGR
jgi:peptidoglycan hydrolase CwlO-like protein